MSLAFASRSAWLIRCAPLFTPMALSFTGAPTTGGSFTGVTSKVRLWTDESASTPPFAMPPSSYTSKLNAA